MGLDYKLGSVYSYVLGGVIMAHGDNDGLILPPKIASTQIVLVPLFKEDSEKTQILEYSDKILPPTKTKV